METRIIKETTSCGGVEEIKYYVQYKWFLFWHYDCDLWGCRWWTYSLEEAQNRVKDLAFKTKREVI